MPSRRHFLSFGLAAAGLCVGNLSSHFAYRGSAGPSWDGGLISLAALTAEPPCSERLGRACLRAVAEEVSSTSLAQLVIMDLELEPNYVPVRKVKRAAQQRVRKDFLELKDSRCRRLVPFPN